MSNDEAGGSAATGGAPLRNKIPARGLIERLASVRLVLWLLAILAAASAVATVVPQKARDDVYERAFGTLLGPLITQTTLRNVYGAWWFVLAFALLTVTLAACCLRRVARLLRGSGSGPQEVTSKRILARQHHVGLRVAVSVDDAAAVLSRELGAHRYAMRDAPVQSGGRRGLVGERGRLSPWAPVLVHIGMVLALLGAAYGRLPSNSYRQTATLGPGQSFTVETGGRAFAIRLLAAGQEKDEEGRPERFWAKTELVEDGKVIKTHVIEPNHPLRHHWVNTTLNSLPRSGYMVEVTHGETQGYIPVVFTQQGGVSMMDTVRRLEDPGWVVFIHDFRRGDGDGGHGPAAKVFVDRSGQLSHNWEPVGWVDEEGLEHSGVRFRLVPETQGAQLSLDRDVGVPIVWLGFAVLSLGSVLLVTTTRRSCIALIEGKGSGAQVLIGVSGSGAGRELESMSSRIRAQLGGKPDTKDTMDGRAEK